MGRETKEVKRRQSNNLFDIVMRLSRAPSPPSALSAQGHTATRPESAPRGRARLEGSFPMRCTSPHQRVSRLAAQPGRGHLARIMRASPHSRRHATKRDGPMALLAEPGVRAEQYSGRADRREHLPWCGVKGKGMGCVGAGAGCGGGRGRGSGRGLGWDGGWERLNQRLCRQRQREGPHVDCRPKARGVTRAARRSVRRLQRGTCGRRSRVRRRIA